MLSTPPPPRTLRFKMRLTAGKRLLGIALAAAALGIMIMACSTSATPSACLEAAEDAGLPDSVIEQLEKPGELNAIERVALREILKKAGLDTVCDQVN